MKDKPLIGLVVPALALGGGVPAAADFVFREVERTHGYRLRVFSLATSSRDECSLRLAAPASWRHFPQSRQGLWEGRAFTHVGAVGVELEFQRYRPRRPLTAMLSECDLVHVVCGSPAAALVATGCGRPVIVHPASRIAVERARSAPPGRPLLRYWRHAMTSICDYLDDIALTRVDAVLAMNTWMLEYARERCAPRGIGVYMAPPGIDAERFRPLTARAAQLASDPYLLFVGRLSDPRKNLALLCRAYAHLSAELPSPPRMVLAGQGELPEAAQKIVAGLARPERVSILSSPGPAEILRLFQLASCLVISSTEEGFGFVATEAMSCGVPPVSTRCGGPEDIISDGEDGLLVPLGDARALAGAMRILVTDLDLNRNMGSRARAKVLARYSGTVAIRPVLEAYDRLLC